MNQGKNCVHIFMVNFRNMILLIWADASNQGGNNLFGKKCTISGFQTYTAYRNSCYNFMNMSKLNYQDAENQCKSQGTGAHLLSITDAFEQGFINHFLGQMAKKDAYLIGLQSKGLSDTNDTQLFEWSDGWPIYYTNWMKNEPRLTRTPQDQCVVLINNENLPRTWRTVNCSTPFHYICKVTRAPLPVSGPTNGVCPKLNGNTDKSLEWVNLHKGSQYCYWFSTERKGLQGSTGIQSRADASFNCRRRNGTLVSLHSRHDSMIIMSRLLTNKYFATNYYYGTWLGLSRDPEGQLSH